QRGRQPRRHHRPVLPGDEAKALVADLELGEPHANPRLADRGRALVLVEAEEVDLDQAVDVDARGDLQRAFEADPRLPGGDQELTVGRQALADRRAGDREHRRLAGRADGAGVEYD